MVEWRLTTGVPRGRGLNITMALCEAYSKLTGRFEPVFHLALRGGRFLFGLVHGSSLDLHLRNIPSTGQTLQPLGVDLIQDKGRSMRHDRHTITQALSR